MVAPRSLRSILEECSPRLPPQARPITGSALADQRVLLRLPASRGGRCDTAGSYDLSRVIFIARDTGRARAPLGRRQGSGGCARSWARPRAASGIVTSEVPARLGRMRDRARAWVDLELARRSGS